MDPALRELLRTGIDDDSKEVEAIIRLDRPLRKISGVRIVSRFGPIATCRLKKGAIIPTREKKGVLSLKAPRLLAPELEANKTRTTLKLPNAPVVGDRRRPASLPLSGAGVIVGIVDWGCDFDHPNFRHPDGSTRLLALWDQRGRPPPGTPSYYGYGVIHDQRQINRALRHADPYSVLGYHPADADPSGSGAHGTHVMDIAAGNGRGGGPKGVSPEADLIFVHLANRDVSGLANLGDSVRILEAVDFIAKTAGRRPWVAGLSLGKHGGPHDGSTLAEMAFDFALREAPNRFIVQSAGNYYNKNIHASGRLQSGQIRTLNLIVDQADLTPNELEVWYSAKDNLSVRTESPSGMRSPWIHLGGHADIIDNGVTVGRIYNRASDPNNSDNHIDIFLYPGGPAGRWNVKINANSVSDGRFHAWLERDDTCKKCQTRFSEFDSDKFYTTGTLANSRIPLVVGSHNAHSPKREIAPFSSVGPTRDNRPKPDLVAPGVDVLAARSTPRSWRRNTGLLVRKSGTSMAAPHVTGTVALCLSAGRPLWSHEIRELILSNTQPVSAPDQYPLRYGHGYLDIKRVVQAVAQQAPRLKAYAYYRLRGSAEHSSRHKEDKMNSNILNRFHNLEQAITESTSLEASVFNLLAEITQANGVSFNYRLPKPDALYREIVSNRRGPIAERIKERFTILARPGEVPRSTPQAGDVLLRVALGEPGYGHMALISGLKLWPHEQLADAPFRSEGQLPGLYARVTEGGSLPHTQSDPFARRILDTDKRVPLGQLLLRQRMPINDDTGTNNTRNQESEEALTQTQTGEDTQPRLVARCRQYRVRQVQKDYEKFEDEIVQWMKTCVMSRTENVRRELTLVRDNPSLKMLWQNLETGKPAHIIPTYSWSKYRIENIAFTSPDVKVSISRKTKQPAVVTTQPDGAVRVPSIDVFNKPNKSATKQKSLPYLTMVSRIITKKKVNGTWWYQIEYHDSTGAKKGWAIAEGIAELVWPGSFTFLSPGSGAMNPFEELRKAVKGKPIEDKVARSINFLNVMILPKKKYSLGDFVRHTFYQALVAAKGNFKEASLIITASIRAFKPDEGGAKFRWVQQVAPKSKGFNYAQYADKLWHFFWNAYKTFDGTSAWTLDNLGIAYELKSRSSPVWSFIKFEDLSRDAKEDIVFNRGGIAFAQWLNKNHPKITISHGAALVNEVLAAAKKSENFNKLTEDAKAKAIQKIMAKKEMRNELQKRTYAEFAGAAEGIVGNVIKAIKNMK